MAEEFCRHREQPIGPQFKDQQLNKCAGVTLANLKIVHLPAIGRMFLSTSIIERGIGGVRPPKSHKFIFACILIAPDDPNSTTDLHTPILMSRLGTGSHKGLGICGQLVEFMGNVSMG